MKRSEKKIIRRTPAKVASAKPPVRVMGEPPKVEVVIPESIRKQATWKPCARSVAIGLLVGWASAAVSIIAMQSLLVRVFA